MYVKELMETKIGKFLVTITDENHIHVSSRDDRDYPAISNPITLNGKDMGSVSAHFNRNPDGIFDMSRGEGKEILWAAGKNGETNIYAMMAYMHISRPGGVDATTTMMVKAYTVLHEALNKWVLENPKSMKAATDEATAEEIKKTLEEIKEVKAHAARLETKLAELRHKKTFGH